MNALAHAQQSLFTSGTLSGNTGSDGIKMEPSAGASPIGSGGVKLETSVGAGSDELSAPGSN